MNFLPTALHHDCTRYMQRLQLNISPTFPHYFCIGKVKYTMMQLDLAAYQLPTLAEKIGGPTIS
jgi:hypothetical protein